MRPVEQDFFQTGWNTKTKRLCENYKLDVDLVEEELIDFKKLYEIEYNEFNVSDLIPTLKGKKQYATEVIQIQESDGEILLEKDEDFEENEQDQDMDAEYNNEEEEEEEESDEEQY